MGRDGSPRRVLGVRIGIHGLEDLSFIGSEDEVRAGVESVADAGATDFTPVVMGADADETAATRALLASI